MGWDVGEKENLSEVLEKLKRRNYDLQQVNERLRGDIENLQSSHDACISKLSEIEASLKDRKDQKDRKENKQSKDSFDST